MHTGNDLPRVAPETKMGQVLFEITEKRLGLTTVVDKNNTLLGIFTDGDLRRLIDKQQGFDVNLPISEVMIQNPATISENERAVEALTQLNTKKLINLLL